MDMSMTEVYDSTINSVSKYIRAKDLASNYKRSEFDFDDLVQGFYLYIFENKVRKNQKTNSRLIDRYDQNRATSSDRPKALYNFIINHLRNYYRTSMRDDLKQKKTISSLEQSLNEQHTNFHNGDILPQKDNEESKLNFCYDFFNCDLKRSNEEEKKSLFHKFRRSLNRLEKGAYKLFIDEGLSPKEVALKLNVTRRTAQNLRNAINFKAQKTLNVY